MDISSRHLPDLSDVSAAQDLSFQIPMTSKSPSKLLFAEDGLDLLASVEDTLNSPLATCSRDSLSAAAPTPKPTRTPRSRRRTQVEIDPSTPLRRSPRKKVTIPSPLKEVAASDTTAASESTLSPFKRQQDFSFQIPTIGKQAMDLLMDDDGVSFLGKGINATFAEGPSTPRAREPLALSQLSPGPMSSRAPGSPFARHTTPLSSQSVQNDENTILSHLGHQQHNASPTSVSGQPSLHSDLKAEVPVLMNDQEELAQDTLRLSSPLLAPHTSGQPTDCMEDDTKRAPDTAEKESTPPHVPPADLAISELDGAAAGTVAESMYNQDVKFTQNEAVIGDGPSKLAKLRPSSAGHARTRSSRSSALRKPKTKSQSSIQAKPQLDHDRDDMLESAALATGSKSRDAMATTLADTTLSDTGGLAAALLTFGQRTAALPISSSAKAAHSNPTPKLDRIESHAGATASGSAPDTDLVREVNEPERNLEVPIENTTVSVTTSGANADSHDQPNQCDISGIPGDHDCSMSAPSHIPVVSPNEEHVQLPQGDVDVDMGDEHNNSLAQATSAEIQTTSSLELLDLTSHDVSMKMPHDETTDVGTMPLPSHALGPTSPMQTAVKRSFEESDEHDRYQPSPESEQAPRRKKAKVSSAPAPAPALTRRTRVLRARTAAGSTSKSTKAAVAVAVRSKWASRALTSRARPAAATHPTSVSALESGVRSSSSRSAAAAHVANGNGSKSLVKPRSESNRPGNLNAPHSIVAVGGSTPTASVHMTRARARAISGGNSSTSSDSAMGASLSGSTAVNRSGNGTSVAQSSSSIAEENPFSCDVRDSMKTGGPGRQEPSHEDGSRTTTTTTVPKRGHMLRSGTNQSSVSIPPAKPTVPVEFHFESEARLEARRTDIAERVADEAALKRLEHYRAMHEAQAEELAARKEHIHPVQPKDFHFSTDFRAQERERWEEARRAREREAERLLEEKRRLETLKEEEEIRELRRRAVPKANEIPGWYQYAPKRSQDSKK